MTFSQEDQFDMLISVNVYIYMSMNLPTQEQHSLYKWLRQLKHSLQQEQFFKSHLQDCVIIHLLTILAQTASLQLSLISNNRNRPVINDNKVNNFIGEEFIL